MISKELLSEVLGYKVDTFLGINKNEIDYTCCKDENEGYIDTSINMYELAHKCKEWAFNNGYYLTIYNDAVDIILQTNCKLIENITDDSFKYSPILVFKACQWILDNKED